MSRKKTEPALYEHITIIAEELTQVIPSKKMTQFIVPGANTHTTRHQRQIEARILDIASTIANAKYASVMFSNFHEWEAFRKTSTKAAARALAPGLITSMNPFGNCLTMAYECYEELRTALASEGPDYAKCVDRVQFVTNNWKQRATSARDYHCITIVRLSTHCIVVDAVAIGAAFAVPLGELFKSPGCSSQGFVYVASGDARLLVEYEPNAPCYNLARPQSKDVFEYDDPYADVQGGLEGAVQDLAFPSVDWHMQGKLPSRRKIMIHQTWDRKPTIDKASFEELEGGNKVVVETAQIRVNFHKRKITVKYIPYADWRKRTQNAALFRRLRECSEFTLPKGGQAFAKFKILFEQGTDGFDEQTVQSLTLMDEMCEQLGMPKGEVLRIANVMLEVWAEHGKGAAKQAGRQQKAAKGRTSGATVKIWLDFEPEAEWSFHLCVQIDPAPTYIQHFFHCAFLTSYLRAQLLHSKLLITHVAYLSPPSYSTASMLPKSIVGGYFLAIAMLAPSVFASRDRAAPPDTCGAPFCASIDGAAGAAGAGAVVRMGRNATVARDEVNGKTLKAR
ncbi:hypothetical protein C7974DRAFT_376474 [Boeremia exigua]|uniref:uncharacterized protein n=1 Tax=Boeremia exigua TaxID=749465 RepID=UPI001E8D699E|nr:uncharacterized protein C7974DRAFT_376474 [Boeremia exigua]KAH6629664.1 hypothetical protein C7974DRAFT_376474 [Boeremia exigua]